MMDDPLLEVKPLSLSLTLSLARSLSSAVGRQSIRLIISPFLLLLPSSPFHLRPDDYPIPSPFPLPLLPSKSISEGSKLCYRTRSLPVSPAAAPAAAAFPDLGHTEPVVRPNQHSPPRSSVRLQQPVFYFRPYLRMPTMLACCWYFKRRGCLPRANVGHSVPRSRTSL
jgi:hypothetical protein